MFYSSNLVFKRKPGGERVQVPYLHTFVCCFAAPSGIILNKNFYAKQQTNNTQAP